MTFGHFFGLWYIPSSTIERDRTMVPKIFIRFYLVCMGITGVAMLVLGISHLLGDQQKMFHWSVVTTVGATNCTIGLVGFFFLGKRDERNAKTERP
jgi:hypothetical protein